MKAVVSSYVSGEGIVVLIEQHFPHEEFWSRAGLIRSTNIDSRKGKSCGVNAMLVTAQDQEERAVIVSLQLFVAIWRRFVGGFTGNQIEDMDALTVLWANTPFPFWNFVFISDAVHSTEQLKTAVDAATAIAATKQHPGLICVCLSLLDRWAREQSNRILAATGHSISMPMTGMITGHFPLALTCPASLRIERVTNFQILTELNSQAYGVPLEAARSSTLSEEFALGAFIYLGYEADRPVCTAAVIAQEDVLYLALVATHEDARNKGYGEAIVRHALQKGHEATRFSKAALHATDMGRPVYERIGFQPVANFRWYIQKRN
jgi:GNAT superfamily N-acetyltransferase